jgi:hypothetical protein
MEISIQMYVKCGGGLVNVDMEPALHPETWATIPKAPPPNDATNNSKITAALLKFKINY